MAIDQADLSAAHWIDVAQRLREVREAERRFLDLWHFESAISESEEHPAQTTTAVVEEFASRWTNEFDNANESQSGGTASRPTPVHRRRINRRRSQNNREDAGR